MYPGHGTKRVGWKSRYQVNAEEKGKGVIGRGGWRKPNPKRRGDEQGLDMRCDVDGRGASGRVTMKPYIYDWSAFYKSSVCAVNVSYLTPGDMPRMEGATEPRAIEVDHAAEVSRGHSRGCLATEGPNNRGREGR